jgi:biotin carboxyl carrier protein
LTRHEIVTPFPGVFYRHPGPDSPPYVKEGDSVEAGQTVGLIEIMKQFNEVKSSVAGVVVSFAVEDNAELEPGALIAIVEAD